MGRVSLKLDARRRTHAGGEVTFDERHLGHEIGDLDKFRLGVAAGDHDLEVGPSLAQGGDDIASGR
jgi:hypothetical protein